MRATFRRRPLWAMWIAGVAWVSIAVFSAMGSVGLLAIPYGIVVAPFTAVIALVTGYFARGILFRRRVLVAIAAFFTALGLSALGLAAGFEQLATGALALAVASLFVAWQMRGFDVAVARTSGDQLAAMSREGIAGRVVISLLIVAVAAGGLWWSASYGPLAGCRADGPRELPSGAPAGQGLEGVSAEGKQVVWGHAGDRVEELPGSDWFTLDDPDIVRAAAISIHGHPGVLFALSPEANGGEEQLAFSWSNADCAETVLLARGTSIESAEAYAGRF